MTVISEYLKFASLTGMTLAIAIMSVTPTLAQTMPVRGAKEIVPPPQASRNSDPNSVTLKSGSSGQIMRSLRVKRQVSREQLRADPTIMLGKTKINLTPFLTNPEALPNIAQRMRGLPQLVEVKTDDTEIYEVEQGLIIRTYLTYQVKLGTCTDAGKKRTLPQAGVDCLPRLDDSQRAAAFADPGDARYVADPTKRARLLADANAKAQAASAQINGYVAQLRTDLRNPAKRAEIEVEIGADQAARLAQLDDQMLKTEIANSGETKIEQTMFVPVADKLDNAKPDRTPATIRRDHRDSLTTTGELSTGEQTGRGLASEGRRAFPLPANTNVTKDLSQQIYLSGFTLGREYEWRKRVEVTIKWCVVGCRETYFGELFAGFNYGLGLRFPMRVDGKYKFSNSGGNETATFTPNYAPINGSVADYAATGLPANQRFDGKELVAQVEAFAGAGYKLPVIGSHSITFNPKLDLTANLPAPFTGGQLLPPAPGANTALFEKKFTNIDLLGGLANFGFAGGKIIPAIKGELASDSLRFKFLDQVSGTATTITRTGQIIPLAINPNSHVSRFTISDPVYNLAFLMTPGITGRLFIDVAVWSDQWDWPVWFPQLAIQLPPGGVDFGCHANTRCTRSFAFEPRPGIAVELEDTGSVAR